MIKGRTKQEEAYLVRVGKRITELMESKNITQLEMAEKLETKNTVIRRIQKGEINTTILTLKRIAKVLGVPLSELTGD